VRDVIRELRERGTTVFLNSHLLSEVEITCDRVAFIKRGRIVRELDLGSGAGGLAVVLRLDRRPDGLLEGLARFGKELSADGQRLSLRVESEQVLPELTRWLAAQGVGLYELSRRSRSLEELFLEIVGVEETSEP
jgi:ABC-2 type transport system ATP-binding protein